MFPFSHFYSERNLDTNEKSELITLYILDISSFGVLCYIVIYVTF